MPKPPAPVKASSRPQKRRWVRRLIPGLAGLVVVALLALGGAAWYFSSQLLKPGSRTSPQALRVVAVDDQTVTLPSDADTRRPGTYALVWPGGRGLLGAVAGRGAAGGVVRSLSQRTGDPLRAGTLTRIDSDIYQGDPKQALGMTFQAVSVPDRLGSMPAWLVPGTGAGAATYVIIVHGLGASGAESLRVLPELHNLGFTSLVISYRNDAGAPASPDHLVHLGDTEWEDLQAAVGEARTLGAHHVVLFGFSMGGAIVTQFIERSTSSADVTGLILDSPVLEWNAVLDQAGRTRGLPSVLTDVAKEVASRRAGVSWGRFDQVARSGQLHTPILLIHGTADTVVPIATSDAFASRRRDLVTYLRVPGADHVESWNVDQLDYNLALQNFLARAG